MLAVVEPTSMSSTPSSSSTPPSRRMAPRRTKSSEDPLPNQWRTVLTTHVEQAPPKANPQPGTWVNNLQHQTNLRNNNHHHRQRRSHSNEEGLTERVATQVRSRPNPKNAVVTHPTTGKVLLKKAPPARARSMPVERKKTRQEQMKTTFKNGWETHEFTHDDSVVHGPGFANGRSVEKIGDKHEQVGWNKQQQKDSNGAISEPFVALHHSYKHRQLPHKSYKTLPDFGPRHAGSKPFPGQGGGSSHN